MEKIRIFYAADLHGDFDSLKTIKDYIKEIKPDVTLITGDLIHIPFSEKELETYLKPHEKDRELKKDFIKKKMDLLNKIQQAATPDLMRIITQETFNRIQTDEITDMELYALSGNPVIIPQSGVGGAMLGYSKARDQMKEFQKDIEEHEEKYIKIAENNMKNSYEEIKKILSGIGYLTLPGNHDGKCLEEILGEESLHKKVKNVKDLKITGYGGAAVTMEILSSTFVEFVEGRTEKDGKPAIFSEPLGFLMKENPDIAVTHEIPLGAIPKIGSEGLGIYVAEKKPALVLSAHMHMFHGVYPFQTNNKTILVMPGKLGRVEEEPSERHNNLRTFAEIEATRQENGLNIDKVTIKRLTDKDEIKILSEYYPNNL